jgi:hypothetical protein
MVEAKAFIAMVPAKKSTLIPIKKLRKVISTGGSSKGKSNIK